MTFEFKVDSFDYRSQTPTFHMVQLIIVSALLRHDFIYTYFITFF